LRARKQTGFRRRAEWEGELIAQLSVKRAGLGEAKGMGTACGRQTKAGLGDDEPKVLLVALWAAAAPTTTLVI
jgi:hypothetical protein